MILRIKTLSISFLMVVILFGGCAGCGQKTAPKTLVVPPNQLNPDVTPTPSGVKQNNVKPKPRGKIAKLSPRNFGNIDFLASLKDVKYVEIARDDSAGIPLPWEPIIVSLESWKKRRKIGKELYQHLRSGKLSSEEYNKKLLQLHREHNLVTSVQMMIELRNGAIDEKITRLANPAYAENPGDFDTLLTWVFAGGNLSDSYGEEKTAGARRLYQMNPNHPWVLHKLAKCLLGTHPEEALGYAQKAQELDPRYLPFGVEGLCYFQMGDYEKALAAFERSHKAGVATSHPRLMGVALWVDIATNVINNNGEGEEIREKIRRVGQPILGREMPGPLRR